MSAKAYEMFFAQGTKNFQIGFGYGSGKSLFDLKEKKIDKLHAYEVAGFDSLAYHYELGSYLINFGFAYSITDRLSAGFSLPLAYNSLEETYDKNNDNEYPLDSNKKPLTRKSHSLFQPDYYAISLKYELSKGTFYSSLLSELRVPPGFHYGVFDDKNYDFLSDGSLQFILGGNVGANLDGLRIGAKTMYYFRAEEFTDQLLATVELGLSTVEDTELSVFFTRVVSTESWRNVVVIDPRRSIIQEDISIFGVNFEMLVNNEYIFHFLYKLPLAGKNTLNVGGFYLEFSYLVK